MLIARHVDRISVSSGAIEIQLVEGPALPQNA
jgi:hypothetical protein